MRDPGDHVENETYVRSLPTCGNVQIHLQEFQYERFSEARTAMEQIITKLHDVTGAFFDVTELEWTVNTYASEHPPDSTIRGLRDDETVELPETLTTTLSGGSLDADSALTSLQQLVNPVDGPWYPTEVTFDGRTSLYIDGEWQSVGADTPELFKAETASPHRDQRFEDPELTTDGPLGINIDRRAISVDDQSLGYQITVWLNTNIWNEDTTVGKVNRKQLEAFLARLCSEFDIAKVYCGERAQNSLVEDFVDPDLIF